MSKATNKTLLGAFVVGAIALTVLAVAVFGSGRYFKKSQIYEIYFEGSVNGLSVGAPVLFRGVQIGSVKDISLEFTPSALEFHIPVIVEIFPDKARYLGPSPTATGQFLKPLIDKGLRAQLITQSIITGQLAIAVDFFPEKPAKYFSSEKKYPEVPSVSSSIQEITKTLQELPIKQLMVKLDSTVSGINEFVGSGSAQASVKSLEKMLKEATAVLNTVNARINPLIENLQATSTEIRSTVARLDSNMSGDDGMIQASKKTVARADEMLAALQQIAQENSAMGRDIGQAVEEMSRSLRSFRVLSDYLERHPESILRGKK